MAISEQPKPAGGASLPPPSDLLPLIRSSGILLDRQFEEVRAKVRTGDYPLDATALARRLVAEGILTDYQARRLLNHKPHGMLVGRYAILDRLGAGSMGRVYKAQHLLMGRVVAVKVLAPEIVTNARVVSRFQREMRLVGRLDHPNVVRAFDADQLGKVFYLVMEYVPGQSLGHRLRDRGVIPPAELVDYAAQAASGLAHAHSMGVVHRDIKPSNLLATDDRQLKVLDLGLGVLLEADSHASFATADGIAVGTIDYMSPEQASGRDVDGRSDLFSLGCAMYHLLSGKVPYPGASPVERLGQRVHGRPVPITEVRSDLPTNLVRVLDKLLAHAPKDRFQDGNEAAEALQALLRRKTSPRPALEPPQPQPEPIPPPVAEVPTAAEPLPPLPAWFLLLVGLAERSPVGALLVVLTGFVAALAAGFILALAVF